MKKAAATRLNILQKAFELIYVKGYQTTSIDEILATTQVTKGAFYYHFKNKDEMGLAIINELLKPSFDAAFINPLKEEKDALKALYDMMYQLLMKNDFLKVEYGCPASNFTQEMAPWNKTFTKALNDLSEQWKQAIIHALETGKKSGMVNFQTDGEQVAVFIMSGYWGIRNLGKLKNSKSVYQVYLKQLKIYLETLR
ncbi:TetR/AcrR family transcriptional regulator [Chitinophaga qingshengii]|uniref:TetR/AcrR family transcriptional regulator n=1 Tax=Chitinophaga qingshengii TaxID=1569794 RepID=A0ABR7TGE9_9BACT|nr:TetR/AcrR family transcriptional regulator [Chitinophaga qingshengii]MBC9928998.1 TetR/AcrR family transcriptional regulator [Chitinophaga qingshengii]